MMSFTRDITIVANARANMDDYGKLQHIAAHGAETAVLRLLGRLCLVAADRRIRRLGRLAV